MRNIKRANTDWNTPEGNDFKWEHVAIEVMMDVRSELRSIRRLMECRNVQAGFIAMQRLEKRMAKRFPLRAKNTKASRDD